MLALVLTAYIVLIRSSHHQCIPVFIISEIYVPKANVTSIWHMTGNAGPGWQKMRAEVDHNEFMANSQVALCECSH